MAAAELQGKYQKLAQEYSKVPGTGTRSPGCSAAFCGPGVPPPRDEAEAASGGAREVRVCTSVQVPRECGKRQNGLVCRTSWNTDCGLCCAREVKLTLFSLILHFPAGPET